MWNAWRLSAEENRGAWDLYDRHFFVRGAPDVFRPASVHELPKAPWTAHGELPRASPPGAYVQLRRGGLDRASSLSTALGVALRVVAREGERVWLLDWQHEGFACVPVGADARHEGPSPRGFGNGDVQVSLATDLRFGYHAHFPSPTLSVHGSELLRALESALPGEFGALLRLVPGFDLRALVALPPADARRDYERAIEPEALLVRAKALRALADAGHAWALDHAVALLREHDPSPCVPALFDLAAVALKAGSPLGARALTDLLRQGVFWNAATSTGSDQNGFWDERGVLRWDSLREALGELSNAQAQAVRDLADRYYAPQIGAPLLSPRSLEATLDEWHDDPLDLAPYGPVLASAGASERPDLQRCVRVLSGADVPPESLDWFVFSHWDGRAKRWARCDERCARCERPWPDGDALWELLWPVGGTSSQRRFVDTPGWILRRGDRFDALPRRPSTGLEMLTFASDPRGVERAETLVREVIGRLPGWPLTPHPGAIWSFEPGEPALPQTAALMVSLGDALACCARRVDSLTAWESSGDGARPLRDLVLWDLAWRTHPWVRFSDAEGRPLRNPFEPWLSLWGGRYRLQQLRDELVLYCPPLGA